MRKWLRQLFCLHTDMSNELTVSGYGYTEYQICFCCECDKPFIWQTRDQQ